MPNGTYDNHNNLFDQIRIEASAGTLDDPNRSPVVAHNDLVRWDASRGDSGPGGTNPKLGSDMRSTYRPKNPPSETTSLLDRPVTPRDLIQGGILTVDFGRGRIGSGGGLILDGDGTQFGGSVVDIHEVIATVTGFPYLPAAPTPANLAANGTYKAVILTWDLVDYQNHGYTEIWRAATNNLGAAVLIGQTHGRIYVDENSIALGNTYYYWVREVTNDATPLYGSFNAGTGGGTSGGAGKIGNVDLGPLIVQAGNLADGSVSAAKVAAGAIDLTKFASGLEPVAIVSALPDPTGYAGPKTVLLTTDGKVYRYVAGAWSKSLDGTDIQPNSITTGAIAAAAITATQIAAGAITTGKLLITGNGAAINDDPGCRDITAWVPQVGATIVSTVTDGKVGAEVLRLSAVAGNYSSCLSRDYPCSPGKTYRLSIWARMLLGVGQMYARIFMFDSAGANVAYNVGIETIYLTSSWVRYRGTLFAPANAWGMHIELYANYPSGGVGVTEFQDIRLEEAADYDLIVDGAIIASKLAASSITVGSAAIQNGAIRNALIENAAIDSAKIADAAISNAKIADAAISNAKIQDATILGAKIGAAQIGTAHIVDAAINSAKILDASIITAKIADASIVTAKIADANITNAKIGDTIQSTGFVAGSTGWRIQKSTDTIEVRNVIARGDIQATSLNAATGTFTGALSAATGTFAGTLTAAALIVAGNSIFSPAYASAISTVSPGSNVWTDLGVVTAAVDPGSSGVVVVNLHIDWVGESETDPGAASGGGDP